MKKIQKMLLVVVLFCSMFVVLACGKKVTKLGILQYVSVDALTQAKEGFIDALEKAGYVDGENIEIILRNPEADDNANATEAVDLIRTCDIVLGIATPSAVALQTAAKNEGINIPILFTAVTDPVAASLLQNEKAPEGNITGTSDMNPVNEQVDLICELLPEMKKIGIIYTVTEVNSKVQSDMVVAKATNKGLTSYVETISGSDAINEIGPTVNKLLSSGVDAIYVPTDNVMAKNIQAIISVTESDDAIKKVPLIVGEASMITSGGTITLSINYVELGKLTGEMAVKLIEGTKVVDIPVGRLGEDKLEVVVNETSLKNLGITLPESIKNKLK